MVSSRCGDKFMRVVFFSVSKSCGRQQNLIMAERPHLANPSCFVDLMFLLGQEVYMSKRDVHT